MRDQTSLSYMEHDVILKQGEGEEVINLAQLDFRLSQNLTAHPPCTNTGTHTQPIPCVSVNAGFMRGNLRFSSHVLD